MSPSHLHGIWWLTTNRQPWKHLWLVQKMFPLELEIFKRVSQLIIGRGQVKSLNFRPNKTTPPHWVLTTFYGVKWSFLHKVKKHHFTSFLIWDSSHGRLKYTNKMSETFSWKMCPTFFLLGELIIISLSLANFFSTE